MRWSGVACVLGVWGEGAEGVGGLLLMLLLSLLLLLLLLMSGALATARANVSKENEKLREGRCGKKRGGGAVLMIWDYIN